MLRRNSPALFARSEPAVCANAQRVFRNDIIEVLSARKERQAVVRTAASVWPGPKIDHYPAVQTISSEQTRERPQRVRVPGKPRCVAMVTLNAQRNHGALRTVSHHVRFGAWFGCLPGSEADVHVHVLSLSRKCPGSCLAAPPSAKRAHAARQRATDQK